MSAAEGAAARGRASGDPGLALWTAVAVLAAALPISRVVLPSWLPQTVLVVAVVTAAGWAVRRSARLSWPILAEAAAWLVAVTVVLPAAIPRLVVVPSLDTVPAVRAMLSAVVDELLRGVAPVRPTPALSWTITAAIGLLAIAMAHVALTARLPLLAATGLIAVALIPSLVVPQRVDVVYFVPLAVAILLLLRADTRARDPRDGLAHAASASAVAAVVGVVAVVAALAIPPFLPQPVAKAGTGIGPTTTIDADLDLGASLRQPAETEVLRVTTDAGSAPYLRVATLSSFDGEVWTPDTGALTSVAAGLPPLERSSAERVAGTARIDVTKLAGSYLPLPYAAVELEGVDEAWSLLTANRTLVTNSATSLDAQYTVSWERPAPTREEAQQATVGGEGAPAQALELPALPAVIPELAAEVTESAESPYDQLRALQGWFRGGAFRYSLNAPVEEGFDGSGVEAIARFLDERAGYCVHFASAFAVMARTLGIPTRVVVGYLPGTSTGQPGADGTMTYSVTSGQLHSWPEAHLDGIGWVAFDPTASLGVPTNFLPETPTGAQTPTDELEGRWATPRPTPTTTATAAPGADAADASSAGGARGSGGASTALGVATALVLALLVPFLVRVGRRRGRLRAPDGRRAEAAWRELVDTAIDAGYDVSASESPRALGARLVAEAGAPAPQVALLVGAVERAAYAREGDDLPASATADALRAARRAILPRPADRLRAAAAPRSLVVRPSVDELV
ncbi:hypothetical protein GCM10022219_26910 [Microbacterium oryzae]|uniref:Transglutaminase domain-containing protein n=1 Tax=Microbacterium oryzae TaxID=743009 RepID=A0A6I6DUJ0_9MICO|nr:DUF3488 and transglutaminase-like domain-containing protein [Microbacterium oryzae]QGU28642.1 transglutaminase domain-containing protein [Microbacterium oryzae]